MGVLLSLFVSLCFAGHDRPDDRMDPADRYLVGKGVSYEAVQVDPLLLAKNMQFRRDHAWKIFEKLIQPVAIKHPEITHIPVWQTWYDEYEFGEVFRKLFTELTPEQQQAMVPFSEERITRVLDEMAVERGKRVFDSERFQEKLRKGFHSRIIPDLSTTLFSPEFVLHYLRHYKKVYDCTTTYLNGFGPTTETGDPENFSVCFDDEFPVNAVMIKAMWVGNWMPINYYDSTATGIAKAIDIVEWLPKGSAVEGSLNEKQIYSVKAPNGDIYQLAGFHAVTKETREWVWATYWWDPNPNSDLGADRPKFAATVNPGFSNYKMCAAVNFAEQDPYPGKYYQSSAPALATALETATKKMSHYTWCANPHLETTFTRSNCLGCHQHAPVDFVMTSKQQRKNFPADFIMSFPRFQAVIVSTIKAILPN